MITGLRIYILKINICVIYLNSRHNHVCHLRQKSHSPPLPLPTSYRPPPRYHFKYSNYKIKIIFVLCIPYSKNSSVGTSSAIFTNLRRKSTYLPHSS